MKLNLKLNLNKILLIIIFALCFLIILFTLIGFATKKASFTNTYRKKDPSNVVELKLASNDIKEYKEIKTLRALTKPDSTSSMATNIVITPWFSYKLSDSSNLDNTAFIEELSQRKIATQTIILNYFANFTKKELLDKGEKQVKKELIEKINEQFVFGKIDAIYFDDYIFID